MKKDEIINEIIQVEKELYNEYLYNEQVEDLGADISLEKQQFYKGKAERYYYSCKKVKCLLEKIRKEMI